jgi:hypothetical protein
MGGESAAREPSPGELDQSFKRGAIFSTSPRTSGGQAVLSNVAFWKTAKNAVDGFSIYRSLLMRLSKLAWPTLPISNSLSLQVAHGPHAARREKYHVPKSDDAITTDFCHGIVG